MSKLNLALHSAIRRSRLTGLVVAAGAAVALQIAAAPASADTLVYVKNGAVYIARPDGSQARPINTTSNGWAWPSETDGGIIAVAGGLPRTDGTFNPSGSDEIYEFNQQGAQVAGPVPTEGSYSTVGDPEYVSHFRVAPDNSNVAWTDISGFTSPFAAWRNPNGTGTFSSANDSDGAPLPYSSPEWWGPGHLLITHDGTQFTSNAQYGLYNLADGSAPGWNDDEAIGNSPSYQVVASRSGLKWAVMTDDGPDNGGTIHNIAITLETAASTPPTTNIDDTHCTITLSASQFSTNHGSSLASMSFSSDGSTLAWGQDGGIYEANVSNPNDCSAVTGSVHLVVPGGQMPFLGAAALGPPASSTGTGTGGGATGGGGSNSGGGSSSGSKTPGAPNTAITSLRLSKKSRQATLRFRGSHGVGKLSFKCKLDRGKWTSCRSPKTYKHLKKGRHAFAVKAIDRRGKVDPSPATTRFRV
ncbi:MAG: hypothetical protein ACXVEW_01015 [Solirubrobacteraceae bacterium]